MVRVKVKIRLSNIKIYFTILRVRVMARNRLSCIKNVL